MVSTSVVVQMPVAAEAAARICEAIVSIWEQESPAEARESKRWLEGLMNHRANSASRSAGCRGCTWPLHPGTRNNSESARAQTGRIRVGFTFIGLQCSPGHGQFEIAPRIIHRNAVLDFKHIENRFDLIA